jgi:type I restriction enzyme S subunit
MKALNSKGRTSVPYFALLVRGCENTLRNLWTKQGATVESIEYEYLANTQIPLPSADEQAEIVRFIDCAIEKVQSAISRARNEINLLREYRTRLIADVVTGKLDVRKAAARLPEEVEEQEPADAIEEAAELEENGPEDDHSNPAEDEL